MEAISGKRWPPKTSTTKNASVIVINNEHTKYPVIPLICAQLGWKTCANDGLVGKGKSNWDIYWTDYGLGIEKVVRRAHSYQRVNHIPGMINIYRKNNLARALGRMQKLFGDVYDFFPRTWILPHDYGCVKDYLLSRPDRCVIIKPAGSAQGKGIYLALTPTMIQRCTEETIAQAYVMKPLTIDGKKFDMRVYALVTSVDPLRILVYKDGLVRLCTSTYNVPDESNVYESYMHLTNYAVNKLSSNFVQSNDDGDNEERSSKRSIIWLWKWMNEQGIDHRPIWRGICDIIVKTLLSTQAYLSRAYGACKMSAQDRNPFTCFEILGFDIILTDDFTPILLEVNHTPSFRMDSKLDERIKMGLIKDTLQLLNVDVADRTKYYAQRAAVSQVRLYGSTFDDDGDEKRRKGPKEMTTEMYWSKYRDNESRNMGDFALVFPTDEYAGQPTQGMQPVYWSILSAANALISVSGGVCNFLNSDEVTSSMKVPSDNSMLGARGGGRWAASSSGDERSRPDPADPAAFVPAPPRTSGSSPFAGRLLRIGSEGSKLEEMAMAEGVGVAGTSLAPALHKKLASTISAPPDSTDLSLMSTPTRTPTRTPTQSPTPTIPTPIYIPTPTPTQTTAANEPTTSAFHPTQKSSHDLGPLMQAACGFVAASWGHWGGSTGSPGSRSKTAVPITPPKGPKTARSRGYRSVITTDTISQDASMASSSETIV